MTMEIIKFKKNNNDTIILDYETIEDLKTLKNTIKTNLRDNFKIAESLQMKHKIKITNIDEEEIKMDDNDLLDIVKK